MTALSTEAEVRAAVERYFDRYFRERDLVATCELLSPSMHGIGTGSGEVCFTREASEQLYRHDIEQAPNPVQYSLRDLHVSQPAPGVAIASCVLDLHTTIARQAVRFNGVRHSLVWSRHDDVWRLEHIHVSFPGVEHGDDEAYPAKELEDRNAVLERRVDERTAELHEALARIDRLARTDSLTGLANRRSIDETLQRALAQTGGGASTLAVILLDLDRFKRINDVHGHLEGDRILKALSGILARTVEGAGHVGRWGGEELVIIAHEMDLTVAWHLAETIRGEIHGLRDPDGVSVTGSLGVVEARAGDTHETLMARADLALYAAKAGGRDRVERG
ncbi:diguanylate cyclase domain-containing protein [Thioalkalivibrio sp. ALE20]|uniref:diguanylate cyclase domain-containing protein n=1 Tax=Thioalkalivibrio sp. ALE20 TaxID=545275 RepID=UPI0004771A99|nr:diguanylate cyclase [Thioalkalivibrio sp. ALE20]